jgi:hypothetical protein
MSDDEDTQSGEESSGFDMDFMFMMLLMSLLPSLLGGGLGRSQKYFDNQPPVYNIYIDGGGEDSDNRGDTGTGGAPPYPAPDGYVWNWIAESGTWELVPVSGGFR